MTGPEHYRRAEEYLTTAETDVSGNWPERTGETKADLLAAAQVHATLALAAATALGAHDAGGHALVPAVPGKDHRDGWAEALT